MAAHFYYQLAVSCYALGLELASHNRDSISFYSKKGAEVTFSRCWNLRKVSTEVEYVDCNGMNAFVCVCVCEFQYPCGKEMLASILSSEKNVSPRLYGPSFQ